MKKYTDKIVIDYIRGNDIEGITIEELEDDFSFMQKVINYSNDKNMFQLCSSRLQTDFEFIKFIICKFRNDSNFIEKIAEEYLKIADESDRNELAILMCKITKNNDKDRFMQYYIIANIAFLKAQQLIQECKRKCPNASVGMGFIFLQSDEENSDIMLEYFAEKLIDTIPTIQDNQFAQIIHQRWKNPEDIPFDRMNSFLINFISTYDISLANFIKVRPHLLAKLKEEIRDIITNWEQFAKKQEWLKFQLLFERVHEYIIENGESEFLEDDLLYYIGNELGILPQIKMYDIMNTEDIDTILKEITFDKRNMSFDEFRHYSAVKKIMQDTLSDKTMNEDSEETKRSKNKTKVIEINFQNRTKKDHA